MSAEAAAGAGAAATLAQEVASEAAANARTAASEFKVTSTYEYKQGEHGSHETVVISPCDTIVYTQPPVVCVRACVRSCVCVLLTEITPLTTNEPEHAMNSRWNDGPHTRAHTPNKIKPTTSQDIKQA